MKKCSLLVGVALLAHPVAGLAQSSASATSTTTTTGDQKTYTEEEIRASVQGPKVTGPTTDVRRVGTPNNSTLDKSGPAKSSTSTPTPTPPPTPVPPPK